MFLEYIQKSLHNNERTNVELIWYRVWFESKVSSHFYSGKGSLNTINYSEWTWKVNDNLKIVDSYINNWSIVTSNELCILKYPMLIKLGYIVHFVIWLSATIISELHALVFLTQQHYWRVEYISVCACKSSFPFLSTSFRLTRCVCIYLYANHAQDFIENVQSKS